MQQHNPSKDKVEEINVVSGIKIIQTEYKVKAPVFEDVIVERPVFIEKKIEIPSEWDKVIQEITLKISDKLMDNIELVLSARLDHAIDQRIKEIKSPKIVEEVTIVTREINVEKPVYVDIEVQRPVFKDYEVKNPITKDVEVINAVIADKTVINAVIIDRQMTNAIIKDVEVERAIIREKVIDVIHPRYLKMDGTPE